VERYSKVVVVVVVNDKQTNHGPHHQPAGFKACSGGLVKITAGLRAGLPARLAKDHSNALERFQRPKSAISSAKPRPDRLRAASRAAVRARLRANRLFATRFRACALLVLKGAAITAG